MVMLGHVITLPLALSPCWEWGEKGCRFLVASLPLEQGMADLYHKMTVAAAWSLLFLFGCLGLP